MSLVGRLLALTLDPRGWLAPTLPGWGVVRRIAALFFFIPAFLALQLVHWVGFLLDEIFFRGYRAVEVREPLFVVGIPRSGTTFLHRTLAADEERFTTLRLWQLIFAPSVTERRILMLLGRLDGALGGWGRRLGGGVERLALGGMDSIHRTRLSSPEEDYLFLLPAFACFLLVVPFPRHPAVWSLSRLDTLPRRERLRLVRFYRSCLKRHLYVVGQDRQILSKNPSFTPMVGTLGEVFPDARFICCARDPLEAVPSLFSSLEGGARSFGWDVRDDSFRESLLDAVTFYTEHAFGTLDQMPDERVSFVRLADLRVDVAARVEEIYQRFSWRISPDFGASLEATAARSRAYRSSHDYDLESFGLDAAEIDGRFGALHARFQFPREPRSDVGGAAPRDLE